MNAEEAKETVQVTIDLYEKTAIQQEDRRAEIEKTLPEWKPKNKGDRFIDWLAARDAENETTTREDVRLYLGMEKADKLGLVFHNALTEGLIVEDKDGNITLAPQVEEAPAKK